ncbi:MAG: T9SS type A sorting domain-containing protein [Bacteroidia bacterium]
MKKIFTFLICFYFITNLKAVVIYDITTGYHQNPTVGLISPGNIDDDWRLIQTPGSGPANFPAYVSNGILWNGTTDVYGWGTPPTCGRWIAPLVTSSGDAYFYAALSTPAGNPAEDYVYQMQFNYNVCCNNVRSFRFNINAVGFDETPVITLNGHPFTLHSGLIAIDSADLICGLNTLQVRMTNTSAANGFYICGTIEGDPMPITPHVTNAASFCSNDPLLFNGAASTGPIQNYFWEIAECDAVGNYTNPAAVWNSWYTGFPGSINFSTINLGFTPQCGKYYRVKLAVEDPCDSWEETTNIIYIKCAPDIAVQVPDPVCQGSNVTLTVLGNATSYLWGPPINQTGNSVTIIANASTSYPVTGTLNGCSATVYANTIVAPTNLDIDLSTGVVNNSTTLIPFGAHDDTWKVRGVPGTLYTSAHSSLADAIVVSPEVGTESWVSSPNEEWISSTSDANGKPVIVPISQPGSNPSRDYWFEVEFNLPISTYTGLYIAANESAVDNKIKLYLNSQVLNSSSPLNEEYFEISGSPSAFNTLHYPGTIATDQTHYVQGTNTVLAEVENNANYMGLLINAHVKGVCSPRHARELVIPDATMQNERIEATTFIYPNPSLGKFTISCDGQTILNITIKDALCRIVNTIKDVNASTIDISLENENKGFYFVEINYEGQMKPVYKKIIKN